MVAAAHGVVFVGESHGAALCGPARRRDHIVVVLFHLPVHTRHLATLVNWLENTQTIEQ